MNTITAAAQGVLTGSLTTIYTCPANRKFIIKALSFGNFTGAALTLIVEATATSGGTQRRYIEVTVADNETNLAPELINHVLDAAGIIQASGNGLTFIVSGVLVNA